MRRRKILNQNRINERIAVISRHEQAFVDGLRKSGFREKCISSCPLISMKCVGYATLRDCILLNTEPNVGLAELDAQNTEWLHQVDVAASDRCPGVGTLVTSVIQPATLDAPAENIHVHFPICSLADPPSLFPSSL